VTVQLVEASQAPLLARPYYANGDPGPIVAALAQVPELLEVAMPFIGMTLAPSAIPWRTKEIVILRTSGVLECRYCVQSHSLVALDAGLTRAEVDTLRRPAPAAPVFERAADRTLIEWVDAVAGGRGTPPPALMTALKLHFRDHEVVELAAVVGVTMMLNRFCTTLGLPTAPDVLARLAAEGLA
jgi:AhpD family alkylhydroperoxidase